MTRAGSSSSAGLGLGTGDQRGRERRRRAHRVSFSLAVIATDRDASALFLAVCSSCMTGLRAIIISRSAAKISDFSPSKFAAMPTVMGSIALGTGAASKRPV
jgi:hypothetical protein